jgi:hypothetical protein
LQGASAIASVLKVHRGPGVRILIVWEKILPTDWSSPGTSVLARVPDTRAVQFWDPDLLLSKAAQPALASDPSRITGRTNLVTGKHIWDLVAVYPPGARWDASFPQPKFAGAPVADVTMQLSDQLPI